MPRCGRDNQLRHAHMAGPATLSDPEAKSLGCADNNLTGARRQCFYLAVLIGRSKSIHSSAFLRLFAVHSFHAPCNNCTQAFHNSGCDLHCPGGVYAFLRVSALGLSHAFHQVRKQGVPSDHALSSDPTLARPTISCPAAAWALAEDRPGFCVASSFGERSRMNERLRRFWF